MKQKLFRIFLLSISTNYLYALNLVKPKGYIIKYNQNFGKIDGFVQIPKGGKYNTATPNKPEFKELGIEKINYPEFEIRTEWEDLFLYTGMSFNTFKGKADINYNLISHDKIIPKYSNVETKHKYISTTFGTGYYIFKNERIKLAPTLEFSLSKFDYKYKVKTPQSSEISSGRSFGWGALHLGVESSYKLTDNNNLNFNIKYAIPYDSIKNWIAVEIIDKQNLYKSETQELNLLFGIGFKDFEYRDTQKEMQNFIKHKISPILKIGIEYKI